MVNTGCLVLPAFTYLPRPTRRIGTAKQRRAYFRPFAPPTVFKAMPPLESQRWRAPLSISRRKPGISAMACSSLSLVGNQESQQWRVPGKDWDRWIQQPLPYTMPLHSGLSVMDCLDLSLSPGSFFACDGQGIRVLSLDSYGKRLRVHCGQRTFSFLRPRIRIGWTKEFIIFYHATIGRIFVHRKATMPRIFEMGLIIIVLYAIIIFSTDNSCFSILVIVVTLFGIGYGFSTSL